MRYLRSLLATVAFVAMVSSGIAATGDENWDSIFGVPGADGPSRALAFHGDGLVAAGRFSQIGGVNATNVARWDGTNWWPLGSGLSHPDFPTVFALAQVAGALYAGGVFSEAGSLPVSNIARWDGTNWSALGGGVNSIVRAMATDGTNLFVGGTFTQAGGIQATNIAKWDGTNWSALGNGIPGEAVDSLAAGNGWVYAGGRFTSAGSVSVANIARWDGTNWFALGQGLRPLIGDGGGSVIVRALLVKGNELYAGGGFRFAGEVGAANIAKWDGTNWSALGAGISGEVYALCSSGGFLFAGGYFGAAGSVSANDVAQWDGQVWSSLGSGIGDRNRSATVLALACNGTELFAGGGDMTTAGGKPSTNIALWHIPHALSVERTGTQMRLSWPATGSNFVLETSAQLPGTNWTSIPQPPALIGDQLVVTNQLDGATRFYRLRRK